MQDFEALRQHYDRQAVSKVSLDFVPQFQTFPKIAAPGLMPEGQLEVGAGSTT